MNKKTKVQKLKSLPTEKDFYNKTFERVKSLEVIKFKPKTQKQLSYYNSFVNNNVNFVIGSTGSGKSTISLIYALNSVIEGKYNKIYLLRPNTVLKRESLGFIKGSIQDKIAPLMRPLINIMEQYIGKITIESLIEQNIIEPFPLAYAEGHTFHNSVIILDEAQNADREGLKMLLTRIPDSSICFILGDPKQIKISNKSESCFHDIDRFKDTNRIGFFEFNDDDIVRGEITKIIEGCYNKDEY